MYGFIDHYENVFPILLKENIQGCFFPVAKPIEKNLVLDVHKIHFILANTSEQNLVKEIFQLISNHQIDYNLKNPEDYFKELGIPSRFDTKETIFIKRILQRELPKELRGKITDKLFTKFVSENESEFSKNLYLTINEMNEMSESGMYFGSHTSSHEWLTHLEKDSLKNEIKESIDFLKKIQSDIQNLVMCYPYGDYNENVIEPAFCNFRLNILPENIGNLDSLQNLQLKDNEISSLPGNIGNLKNLERLIMESNLLFVLLKSNPANTCAVSFS